MSAGYSEKVETGDRVLYFKVIKNHGETLRLVVKQTRPPGFIGAPMDQYVSICEEDVSVFIEGVLKAAAAMGKAVSHSRKQSEEERYAEVRKTYPNAYRPWTKEEDGRLRAALATETSIREIAKAHGRKAGSIESRIAKLAIAGDDK